MSPLSAVTFKYIPGTPKKTIHCLISCNVKPIKAISIKQKAFHSLRINLDFNMSQFIFHAKGFRNWRKTIKIASR